MTTRIYNAVQRDAVPLVVARDIIRLPDTDEKAAVRARVQAGERVSRGDVQRIREQHSAAGVANPRAKGGGHVARRGADHKPLGLPSGAAAAEGDQVVLDREALPQAPEDALRALLARGRPLVRADWERVQALAAEALRDGDA